MSTAMQGEGLVEQPQPRNVIDISRLIDESGLTRYQVMTILLCGVVAVLDGFDMQAIGYLVPAMAQSLAVKLSSFGTVFSAGLIGITIGSAALGPMADWWGRKRLIIASVLLFGIGTAMTGLSHSFTSLLVWRLVTGLGLGAAMPNIIALTSEYAPQSLRALLVTVLFSGVSAGALGGGLISSLLLPAWGWRSVFYVGAAVPLIAVPAIVALLPESVRFLVVRNAAPARIAAILRRIAPTFEPGAQPVFTIGETRVQRATVGQLFAGGRAAGTMWLWAAFLMNLVVLVFLSSWLPSLLRGTGMPMREAIIAVVAMNLGGVVGSVLVGYFIDRLGATRVLVTTALLCLGLVASFGILGAGGNPAALIMAATFAIGFCVQGGQSGLNALAAEYYPTAIRSTGVGWAFGVGRLGSIGAPLLGGLMLSLGWTHTEIFAAAACPMLVVAISVLCVGRQSATPGRAGQLT